MNRYIVTFVPIGSSSNNDSFDVLFYLKSENIDDIKNEAYKEAEENIDPYSLRNHWTIETIQMF